MTKMSICGPQTYGYPRDRIHRIVPSPVIPADGYHRLGGAILAPRSWGPLLHPA